MSELTADRGVEVKSSRLQERRIAVGICAGIGAVEMVKIIRELRRNGAQTRVFVTPQVEAFIGLMSLEWASGARVVQGLEPGVNHLEDYDLALISPLTLNTLAKSALGIADNPVTLLVASRLGQAAPVGFIPAMNVKLSSHPLYLDYVARLKEWGGRFLLSEPVEGRHKMPPPEKVARFAMEFLP